MTDLSSLEKLASRDNLRLHGEHSPRTLDAAWELRGLFALPSQVNEGLESGFYLQQTPGDDDFDLNTFSIVEWQANKGHAVRKDSPIASWVGGLIELSSELDTSGNAVEVSAAIVDICVSQSRVMEGGVRG